MANATSPLVEQRVIAFSLGHPGFGPARIGAELARPKWGGIHLSANKGLAGPAPPRPANPRQALRAAGRPRRPTNPTNPTNPPTPHAAASPAAARAPAWGADPARLFCIGRLQGTNGHPTQPSATYTSILARQVAAELAEHGWRLERVMTDNGTQFRSATFQTQIASSAPRHSFIRFIRAGRT